MPDRSGRGCREDLRCDREVGESEAAGDEHGALGCIGPARFDARGKFGEIGIETSTWAEIGRKRRALMLLRVIVDRQDIQ